MSSDRLLTAAEAVLAEEHKWGYCSACCKEWRKGHDTSCVMEALRTAVAEHNAAHEVCPTDEWWCPKCHSYVSGETVTYEEIHEPCGAFLGGSVQEDHRLAALGVAVDRPQIGNRGGAEFDACGQELETLRDDLAGKVEALNDPVSRLDSILSRMTIVSAMLAKPNVAVPQIGREEVRSMIFKTGRPVHSRDYGRGDVVTVDPDTLADSILALFGAQGTGDVIAEAIARINEPEPYTDDMMRMLSVRLKTLQDVRRILTTRRPTDASQEAPHDN